MKGEGSLGGGPEVTTNSNADTEMDGGVPGNGPIVAAC